MQSFNSLETRGCHSNVCNHIKRWHYELYKLNVLRVSHFNPIILLLSSQVIFHRKLIKTFFLDAAMYMAIKVKKVHFVTNLRLVLK